MKNGTISSRASIVQRSKGQSAVEQSAYISRTSLYSDYYGMEQTEKQTTDKEQCPHIKKKIGRTTYNVAIHFSKTSRETMTDKINRLILHDINSEDFS